MNSESLKKLNFAIYARKSSVDDTKQIQSIDDQIKIQEEIAKRLGLNVVEII